VGKYLTIIEERAEKEGAKGRGGEGERRSLSEVEGGERNSGNLW